MSGYDASSRYGSETTNNKQTKKKRKANASALGVVGLSTESTASLQKDDEGRTVSSRRCSGRLGRLLLLRGRLL